MVGGFTFMSIMQSIDWIMYLFVCRYKCAEYIEFIVCLCSYLWSKVNERINSFQGSFIFCLCLY